MSKNPSNEITRAAFLRRIAVGTVGTALLGRMAIDGIVASRGPTADNVPLLDADWLYTGLIGDPETGAEKVEKYTIHVSDNQAVLAHQTAAGERLERANSLVGQLHLSETGREYETLLVGHNTKEQFIPKGCKTIIIPQSALAEVDCAMLEVNQPVEGPVDQAKPLEGSEITLRFGNKEHPQKEKMQLHFYPGEPLPDILVYGVRHAGLGLTDFRIVAGMKGETLAHKATAAPHTPLAPQPKTASLPGMNSQRTLDTVDVSSLMVEPYRQARLKKLIGDTALKPPVFTPGNEASDHDLTQLMKATLDPARRTVALEEGIVPDASSRAVSR